MSIDAFPLPTAPGVRIQAIGFDVFGTLIDHRLRLNPYERLPRFEEVPSNAESADALRRTVLTTNLPPRKLAAAMGRGVESAHMANELVQETSRMRLYPDVGEVLSRLRERGYRIGVCSNLAQGYGAVVRELLGDLVDVMVLSYEVGMIKPESGIFELLCARLGSAARATAFIGDSAISDLGGAQSAGMVSRLLRRDQAQTLGDVVLSAFEADKEAR